MYHRLHALARTNYDCEPGNEGQGHQERQHSVRLVPSSVISVTARHEHVGTEGQGKRVEEEDDFAPRRVRF